MKKILLCMLAMGMILSLTCIAAQTDYGGADDDKEVKLFLEDEFYWPFASTGEKWMSGWKSEVIGGEIGEGNGTSFTLIDNSDRLPTIFTREFENLTYGEAFMDMKISFDTNVDGGVWALRNGKSNVTGFTLADGNIAVLTPNGSQTIYKNYKNSTEYYIRFNFDVEQHKTDVYIDGSLVAENVPFVTPLSGVNNFTMYTPDKTTGSFKLASIRIFRGYRVFEQFAQSGVNLPDDWENVDGETKINDGMLEFGGKQKIRKSFTRETRKTVSDFYVLMPKSRRGFEVSVNDGDKRIAGLSTTNEGFAYFTENSPSQDVYKQFENVMYNFRLETDFINHKMNIYINNRMLKKDIPIAADITGADNLTVSSSAGESVFFSCVKVYPVIEYDDYCPEPIVPKKDDFDIIMQMCPMWSEGYHFGYDHLNASPARKPLMGLYDESDPEASDWAIKYMVEHGVDARMSIWYRAGGINAPIREYTVNPQYKTMQNAKYADKMQWCILWENASNLGLGSAEKNLDAFLKYIAPYWIEYYFKDPNYYKINGRPVIGSYYFWTLTGDFTSNPKDGIDKFRQLCIDAGVGNPMFLQDRDAVGEDSETHFKQMDKWGIDLQSQYHQGGRFIESTKESLETAKSIMVRNNFSFQTIPVVSTGFEDYAWGRSTGYLMDNKMIKEAMEYLRDEFFEGLPIPTGRKLLLLATWDEYGEGHYFAPSVGNGFGYLDAVRGTFVGGEHTDILPTEHQADRFNNRYPSWRKAPYINQAMVSSEVPENSYVKKKWDFNTDGDTEGWESAEGFSSVEVKDGYLKCVSNGGKGSIAQAFDNFEASDVLQIRVKYKNTSSAYNAHLYYANQFLPSLEERKAIHKHMYPNSGEGEIVFSTEEYPLDWRGLLYQLKMAFEPMKAGEEFYIDSIEMLAKNPDESKMKLSVNGYVTETDGVRFGADDAMIPARDLAWVLRFDDRVFYDETEDAVKYRSYSDNKIVSMPTNKKTFTINDKKFPSEKYYSCDGGVCRVSTLWTSEVLGKNCYYDADSNTFYINDKTVFVPQRDVEERDVIWSADFDSGLDGFVFGQDSGGRAEEGMMKLRTTQGDPQFFNYVLGSKNIECADAKMFAIKASVAKACQIKVYFSTSTHSNVSESNAFYFNIPASEKSQVFTCDISQWVNWDGRLQFIRMDVEDNKDNSLDIDYIRFYGDYATTLSDEEIADMYSSIDTDNTGVTWNFNINNTKDGWKFNKSVANVKVSGGNADFEVIARKPEMSLCGNASYAADSIKEIQIGMNASKGKSGKLYFVTDTDGSYSEDKSFTLELSNNGRIYKIKPQDNAAWNGKITGLKFVPTDGFGKVSIDYIKLITK